MNGIRTSYSTMFSPAAGLSLATLDLFKSDLLLASLVSEYWSLICFQAHVRRVCGIK